MNEHDETDDLQMPPELVDALRSVQKDRVLVPSQVDEIILRQAREHLRSQSRKILFLPAWRAIAASIALAAGVLAYVTLQTRPQQFADEDINRDGRVDILDAFALARAIEAGEGAAKDINQDGTIDEQDVDMLAKAVVRLNREDRS